MVADGDRGPENYYQRPADHVVAALNTDAMTGLTAADARARLARDGANQLAAERPVPAWRKFLAQFQDVLVILLLIATAISVALWLYERDAALPYEAIAISAVVLLNAVMGYLQEQRAESAIAALQQMAAAHAHVIRDGALTSVPAAEVVPGDILVVEEGDTVAADARVDRIDRAADGRSGAHRREPAGAKDVDAICGRRRPRRPHQHDLQRHVGRPTAAGGRSSSRPACEPRWDASPACSRMCRAKHTPLQKELDRVGKLLGVVVVVIAVVMIATIVVVEHVRGLSALFDVLILGVALAVAAVPEGLPAVVTAVLSIGVQRMARRNAIVRHLSAVETLGSASVIASDKTGTLTQERDDRARGGDRERPRDRSSGTGYAPAGDVRGGRRRRRSPAICESNWSARSPSPTARTTPSLQQQRWAAGPCRAIRPKAR